ncbi:terminase large subunit domain-containing protein [Gordonibacter urolithinfaciens]|uniref:terminase large subunit domain-containing protein n=1 Tax=Gordonibacter urolithinfaciens TaxID=1335613 RepID=UPI003A9136CB
MYRTRLEPYTAEGVRQADVREVYAELFLTHAGNDDAAGTPWLMEPWTRDNIWRPIFAQGAMDPKRGKFRRRFRRAVVGVWRGFGKSEAAAAITLAEADCNPVPNGQYGIVADTKDNTKAVRDYLKVMVNARPELRCRWEPYKDYLVNNQTMQEIHTYPYGEAPLQGKHFNLLVCDEIHVWRDDSTWKAGVSGQRNVWNPLTIAITTAGASRDSAAYKLIERMKRDPHAYVCWLGLDDADDMTDRRTWRKLLVNDRMTMDDLEDQCEALGWPDFERYQLNRFPLEKSENPFMAAADVDACTGREGGIDWGSWFTVGVDGATSGDTLAVVAYQRQGDRDVFAEWIWDDPTATAAGVYDLTDVADVLQALASKPGRPLVCCDPNRLQFLANWLERERGMEVFGLDQSPKAMCPASELLARSVKTRSACMAASPVLARHCRNAVAAESKAYGRRISSKRHGQGTERVDAAIAAAMAMWAHDNCEPPAAPAAWTIDL